MRSHRTLIPFIALAVTLAANAAPVLHPLGARASDTNILHMRHASPTPDLLEAQSNADVDFNADSLLRSRTVEPRAKKKNKQKKNKQRKQRQQQQKAKAGGGGGQTNTSSDGQGVPVPEGNKEATPNGGKVEAAQAPPKKPQPANEANGNTHAGPSHSGASGVKEKEKEPVSAATTPSSDHEPKPGGLSRVNTGSSISSTSSHSSTSSDGSVYSCSSHGSTPSSDPYEHDHMYGTHCDPVPHQPAEEAGASKEEEDKEKEKEDQEKSKKKGKQKMRNLVGGASAVAGLGLLGAGIYGIDSLAKSSKSAFTSVGSEGESSESSGLESSGSESSGLDGIQFGSTKRDIEL